MVVFGTHWSKGSKALRIYMPGTSSIGVNVEVRVAAVVRISTNQMGLHLLALFVPLILGVVHRYC
jgi:hypothetical protein